MGIRGLYGQSLDEMLLLRDADLGKLWRGDSLLLDDEYSQEEGLQKIAFPEPIGFIGEDFQRFYIHYTSVKKDARQPQLYHVTGKTRVKDYICSFAGWIRIDSVTSIKDTDQRDFFPNAMSVHSTIQLYEDSSTWGSGVISAQMNTFCYRGSHGAIVYDTHDFVVDGFSNNLCTGMWASYRNGKCKRCNWGDFRIPGSGGLDVGAGEFAVAEKYVANGWESYMASSGSPYDPDRLKAVAEEMRHWWE